MGSRTRTGKVAYAYKLDLKPYADLTAKMQRLIAKALGRYGEPRMSLAELRTHLDHQLRGASLSELITKEREAGW